MDLPEEAPEDWKALIESVLECSSVLNFVNKEHKERKGELEKRKRESEDALVRELDELPGGTIRSVSLTSSEPGCLDTYYVRVKPAKKLPCRKISCGVFGKTLRKCIHDTLVSLDAHTAVSDMRVGELLCRELRPELEEKERRAPETRRRVSLDKMRSKKTT